MNYSFKKIIIIFASFSALVFGHLAAAATVYEVAVMPDAKIRTEIWPMVSQILMTAAAGDAVTIMDPSTGLRIASFKVTEEMASSPNANARTVWLVKKQPGEVLKAKKFLLEKTASGGSGDFVRWSRSLEIRKTEFANVTRISGIFFGSPLVAAPEAYSMKHRYPSDAFLFLKDASLFSTVGKEQSLRNVDVHVVHSANLSEFSDRNPDFHHAKIKRFYSFFVNHMGGNLASFGGSSDHLRNIVAGTFPKPTGLEVDRSSTKPIVYEVNSPMLEREDAAHQKNLWEGTIEKNPSPPSRPMAKAEMGITWNQNVDLDIYVMPTDDLELFYQKTSSSKFKGRFIKDIMSRPGTNGFETVIYDAELPLKSIQVYVNHYSGSSTSPIEGEFRIRIDGATYSKKFVLNSPNGTSGKGNRDQHPAWLKIDVAKAMGL